MKFFLLKAAVYLIEFPLIVCIVMVFLLWTCIHWIDDEWMSE
jgi:hypothetical protein